MTEAQWLVLIGVIVGMFTYVLLGGRFVGPRRQDVLSWGMVWRSIIGAVVGLAVILVSMGILGGP